MTITENQKKWLDALRSGEYKQGRGNLRSEDNKMCCLGVACELALADGVEMDVTSPGGTSTAPSGYEYRTDRWQYDGRGGMPNDKVLGWLGIPPHAADRLADLNDTGSTFQEIADIFESGELHA